MQFKFKTDVRLWPTSVSPWHYVDIPKDIVEEILKLPLDRGLKKITAKIGDYSWKTSIMPAGKGKKIVPLSAKVRKDLKISIGDKINITIEPIDL